MNFEEPIKGKEFDNTHIRIYGEKKTELMTTNNHEYGAAKNAADGIARVGRKQQNFEKQIQQTIAQELAQKAREEEEMRQMRYFDTTNKETFYQQDLTANVVGRKVMKTQDGKLVPMDARDDALIVEHGIYRRTQKATDDELRNRVPQGDYTVTRPVTIYTEALERKNHYMSAATGPNPFSRTSGFTQPLNQTKAVKEYEGNVDFDKEKTVHSFTRTHGRDLNVRNPYMEKYVQISNFDELRDKVIALCRQRSANGLRGLRILFRGMDRNRNGSLDPVEFKYAMRDYGIKLSEIEVTQIVKYFDTNKDGKISFDEFLRAIRGDLN